MCTCYNSTWRYQLLVLMELHFTKDVSYLETGYHVKVLRSIYKYEIASVCVLKCKRKKGELRALRAHSFCWFLQSQPL